MLFRKNLHSLLTTALPGLRIVWSCFVSQPRRFVSWVVLLVLLVFGPSPSMQKAPSLVSCVVCKRFSTSHTSASQSKFWTPHNGHAGYLKEVMGSKEQDSTGTQRNFLHQIFHLLLCRCLVAQPYLCATGRRVFGEMGSVSCHDDAVTASVW